MVPTAIAKTVIRQTCSGLAQVHENRVIHRDIKPENILLRWGGPAGPEAVDSADLLVVLADF
eukprot:2225939-Alexandrium_andersonii.AAC.1